MRNLEEEKYSPEEQEIIKNYQQVISISKNFFFDSQVQLQDLVGNDIEKFALKYHLFSYSYLVENRDVLHYIHISLKEKYKNINYTIDPSIINEELNEFFLIAHKKAYEQYAKAVAVTFLQYDIINIICSYIDVGHCQYIEILENIKDQVTILESYTNNLKRKVEDTHDNERANKFIRL